MVSGMSQGGDFYLVAKKVYTLGYDANGENVTGMPETQTAVSSTGSAALTISSVKPQREGYTFLGWADKKDAANPNVFVGKDVTLTSAAPVKSCMQYGEPHTRSFTNPMMELRSFIQIPRQAPETAPSLPTQKHRKEKAMYSLDGQKQQIQR